jgi:hypothetical protein
MPKLCVANLWAAERLMASLRRLVGGGRHFFPKGVHRYRSHEEADAAWLTAVAADMAELDRERRDGSREVCPRRDRR